MREVDLGVLAGHAPLVTRCGLESSRSTAKAAIFGSWVNGGFAEVGPAGLTVLADTAVPLEAFDRAVLAGEIKDTEEDFCGRDRRRAARQAGDRLDQLRALQAALPH